MFIFYILIEYLRSMRKCCAGRVFSLPERNVAGSRQQQTVMAINLVRRIIGEIQPYQTQLTKYLTPHAFWCNTFGKLRLIRWGTASISRVPSTVVYALFRHLTLE